ncbi:hypothetical protein ACFSSA_11660 [Luteolibacter algae]|uniref:Uncharacterized protein n=1 Tax=Luteolibacter algae TaxID=454151 RepID=A0ABW5D8E3_9BACT
MDSGNHKSLAESGEQELSELLQEAELRKQRKLKETGSRVGWVIGIPVILLFLWASIFLLTYENPTLPEIERVKASQPVSTELTSEQKDMAQYDLFRDEKERVIKNPGIDPEAGKMIKQEDIRFAVELLNFMRPPTESK